MAVRPYPHIYHGIFKSVNGEGPWPCYADCGEPVLPGKLCVHHIDEDPWNNDPSNLASMHLGCHMRFHTLGKTRPPFTDEHRNNIRTAQTKLMASAENRQRISDALIGRTLTDEHRKNISEAQRGKPHYEPRWHCGDCDRVTTARGLDLHQKWTGHTGKEPT
jgi:hypothetical protein